MNFIVKYIHMLSLVVWFGGMIFFSFIAAPSVFKVLPREAAGDVVGDIFPKYFLIGYVSSVILLGTLGVLWRGNLAAVRWPLIVLLIMTALTFVSGLAVGSKARAIKAQIRQTADEVKKEELTKSFRKIHGISMIINLTVIILSLVYLAYVPLVLRI